MKIKRQSLILIILLLGIILILFWLPTNRALLSTGELRAAIDIGSGATNLKIAKVDPKTNKIVAELFNQTISVPYQAHLEQSPNNTLDQNIMNQGIRSIKILKEIADSYQVKHVVAVATAAFRKAANAEQFAREIEEKTGVKVRIINQDEEGILAFRAALAVTPIQPQDAVVWDIGGGSMQLTTLSDTGTYLIDKGHTASVPFKNFVIQEIQHKDLSTTASPNPLTIEEMRAAIHAANQFAQKTQPFIQDKIKNPQTHVLGVGNLFNYSIRPLVNSSTVHQEALENAVFKFAGKSDAELPGGAHVSVTVTNPLLVLGYMQGLNIQQVNVVNINNADGALTYPPYWE